MCCAFVEKLYVCLQLLLGKALSCHVQNFKIVSEIQEIYSTRVIVCQCCERLFVSNGLWRVEFVVVRSVVMAEAGFMGSGDWGKM